MALMHGPGVPRRINSEPRTGQRKAGQGWFDNPATRGRARRDGPFKSCSTGGIADDDASLVGEVWQERIGATEEFQRDDQRESHPAANAYFDECGDQNLCFVGSISGTTSTLLAIALSCCALPGEEMLKEYVLAIVGYLVGGGYHCCHEVFKVAIDAGIPYRPATYLDSLPASFRNCPARSWWRVRDAMEGALPCGQA
jgi:hypothetical protein